MLLRKNDSGRSIVEMLGVLAIMGVITVMGISGYSQAVGKINRNKVVEDVTRAVQEIRGLYAGKTNVYTTVPTGSEDDDILLSIGFRSETDKHPFGGVYFISQGKDADNGVYRNFSLHITGLGKQDCYYLCTTSWQGSAEECVPNSACPDDEDNELILYFE